jgi:hypothetical protein
MRAPSSSLCRFSTVLPCACLTMLVLATSAAANVALTQIAFDPFTNPLPSQHRTIVGPDTFSFGSTIVAAAQFGRFLDDGASGVGFATSTNIGNAWISGILPGLTGFTNPPGPYARVSDPSVAYDAKHNVWMISTLALQPVLGGTRGQAILTSRSTDGGLTWGNPVTTAVATGSQDFDKNWIVCDNTPKSSYYGSCSTQWDDFGAGNRLKAAYSRDGGLTWKLSNLPPVFVVGGQPLVLPNGRVVVVFSNAKQSGLGSMISTSGGISFAGPFTISTIAAADDPGTIRSDPLSSAEVSGDGTIFVVWADCRYRGPSCPNAGTPNDLVYKTSTTGTSWKPSPSPTRIPIDPVGSSVDHFIPGVAVDKATFGPSIHVGVAYYFSPNANCTFPTCQLSVGYISSDSGGSSWSPAIQLAGPMMTTWLPDTTQGRMVGDYISTSFDALHLAHPVFALANPSFPTNECLFDTPNCDQALYTPALGLIATGGVPPTTTTSPFPGGSPGAVPQKR